MVIRCATWEEESAVGNTFYQPSKVDVERIEKACTYHQPKDDQQQRYLFISGKIEEMMVTITQACPQSRERSLALTKLEEAKMWANASIARNE